MTLQWTFASQRGLIYMYLSVSFYLITCYSAAESIHLHMKSMSYSMNVFKLQTHDWWIHHGHHGHHGGTSYDSNTKRKMKAQLNQILAYAHTYTGREWNNQQKKWINRNEANVLWMVN